ncbi:hypothetical protein [Paracoccus sp. KR1-242]|uniref:hypothetical protein n=1 Tax=Paracoccus sp. KR1-242 TaxID=3410028 RepID=UPI003C061A33
MVEPRAVWQAIEKAYQKKMSAAFGDLSIALAEVKDREDHLAERAGKTTTARPAPKPTISNPLPTLPRFENVIKPDSLRPAPMAAVSCNGSVRPLLNG